jgi:UDP-N-acetylmuramate dehydrogenase
MLVSERGFRGAAVFLGHDDDDRPRKRNGMALFRNPEPLIASDIIRGLGLQGRKSGGASVAIDDANTVVNDGRATSEDILSLIRSIQADVWRTRGIALEADIQLVGFAEPAFSKVA